MSTVLQALNEALHDAMQSDERVVFLGEDILDPYGGAFKVARGLSTRFPDRVWTTPISEAAITGIGVGMALRGLRPVVEIMFGDFLGLAYDQILNHATKLRWMYNHQVRVPLVVRTAMGGRRGYGATHSQNTEKHFLGIPGLRVVAPTLFLDPKRLLTNAILHNDDPLLFVEHKLLYNCPTQQPSDLHDLDSREYGSRYPALLLRFQNAPDGAATLASYGYMSKLVLESMWRLAMEREIFVEAVIYTQLSPLDPKPLLDSVVRTQRLITVEEGNGSAGWGSEVACVVAEHLRPTQLPAVRRIAARDLPIPSARPMEDEVLPSVDDIVEAVLQILQAKKESDE